MGARRANVERHASGHRVRYWFAGGNLLIAMILVCADLAIPVGSVWQHAPVAVEALLLWASAFAVLFRHPSAVAMLRIAAVALLAFGLLAVALLALSAAFLFGVHGHFLRDGLEVVVIGLAILVPYTLAYPIAVLASTTSAKSDSWT